MPILAPPRRGFLPLREQGGSEGAILRRDPSSRGLLRACEEIPPRRQFEHVLEAKLSLKSGVLRINSQALRMTCGWGRNEIGGTGGGRVSCGQVGLWVEGAGGSRTAPTRVEGARVPVLAPPRRGFLPSQEQGGSEGAILRRDPSSRGLLRMTCGWGRNEIGGTGGGRVSCGQVGLWVEGRAVREPLVRDGIWVEGVGWVPVFTRTREVGRSIPLSGHIVALISGVALQGAFMAMSFRLFA